MPKHDSDSAIDLDLPLPFQISQLSSLLNAQAREILSRYGELNLAQWRILRLVAWGVASTTTSVRKAAGIDKGQFSKTLNGLVKDGYIELSPYEDDKRQYQISLTVKGEATHAQIKPELVARNEHLMDALTPEEQSALYSSIRALAKAAQKTDYTQSIASDGDL
jgi:DNA-binding MarR family transcriptional regulator